MVRKSHLSRVDAREIARLRAHPFGRDELFRVDVHDPAPQRRDVPPVPDRVRVIRRILTRESEIVRADGVRVEEAHVVAVPADAPLEPLRHSQRVRRVRLAHVDDDAVVRVRVVEAVHDVVTEARLAGVDPDHVFGSFAKPRHHADPRRLIPLEPERQPAFHHPGQIKHQRGVQENRARRGDAHVVLHGRPGDGHRRPMDSFPVGADHPDRDVRHPVAVHVDEVVPDVHHLARVWVRLAVRGHVIEPVILRRQRPAKVAQAERFQIRAEFELVRAAGLVRRQQTAGVVLDAVVGGVFGLDHPERRVRVPPPRELRD
mmetsp:Transcript_5338/g.23794  ORF Transcript_5338/g.23794 Transcript_5338/m.23794 type:complete len:316 (-) Transcript_5338:588-1535(-)